MPQPNGSDAAVTDPKGTTIPTTSDADQARAAWGIDSPAAVSPDPGANPDKKPAGDAKPADPASVTDPDKPADPAKTGTDGQPKAGEQPKKFGDYDTVEALVEGKRNADTHIQRLADDNKQLRAQVALLNQKLTEKPAAGEKPTSRFERLLKESEEDPDFKAAVEAALPVLGEEGVKALKMMNAAHLKRITTELDSKEEAEQQRSFEELEEKFQSRHPELKDIPDEEWKATEQWIKEQQEKDPLFTHELMLMIFKARNLPRVIDDAVNRKLKEMSEEEKNKRIAQFAVTGSDAGLGGAGKSPVKTASTPEARAAWGLEDASNV